MKKTKLLLILIALLQISLFSYGQNKFYSYYTLDYSNVMGVSPNGKYVVTANGDILIPGQDTTRVTGTDYEIHGVSSLGHVVGFNPDSAYMVGGVAVASAAIWKDNKWHQLGQGQITLNQLISSGYTTFRSVATAVASDGKTIVGMSYDKTSFSKVVPFRWKIDDNYNVIDTVTYNYPKGDQGAKLQDIADDGIRGCGWAVIPGNKGTRTPIIFKSPTEYKLLFSDKVGEANSISPNGKYVAFYSNGYAGMYDVDKDSVSWCGRVPNTYASSVSNDGVVIGYHTIPADNQGNIQRRGFIWTENLGYIEFKDFIAKYLTDVTLPSTNNFDTQYVYDVPISISGDGTLIGGWSGYTSTTRWGWALKLDHAIVVPERPRNLTAKLDIVKRNEVTLNWTVNHDATNVLTGFNVYRDSVLISQITDPSVLTYVDANAPAGLSTYHVSAVYGSKESTYSDLAQVKVVDSYALPFSENFDSNSLDTNYWTVNNSANNNWYTLSNSGVYNSPCVIFNTSASYFAYNQTTLTSKPIDARNASNVYVSFNYKVESQYTTGATDTLYVEVSNDLNATQWNVASFYKAITLSQIYTAQRVDLTPYAAGKEVYVRFRFSGKDRRVFTFYLDNVDFTTSIPDAPKSVSVSKSGSYQSVKWQNPAGSDELTYCKSDIGQPIGDEGATFIAANKFEATDLTPYAGKYLTSVSVYVRQSLTQGAGVTPTKLQVIAFVDNVLAGKQDINSFVPNAWNTFKFNTPIAIPEGKTLTFGLNVVQHDSKEMPLFTDRTTATDGKGNLFSEDGGSTWKNLSTYGLTHNWNIIGNVRSAAAENERDDVLGYEVYLGTTRINKEYVFNQQFTDSTDVSGMTNPTYTVKAFHRTLGLSNLSDPFVFNTSSINLNTTANSLNVATVVTDGFTINSDNKNVVFTMMDVNGRVLLTGKYSQETYIDIRSYSNGVYVLTLDDGLNVATKKIIKK